MESHEWVVKVCSLVNSMDETVEVDVETIVELKIFVLVVINVVTGLLASTTKSFLFPILVDAPEIVNSLVDSLIVAISSKQSGCNRPESHILYAQLEHG